MGEGPALPDDTYEWIDLTGAKTLRERIVRIGQQLAMTGTAMNLTKAARCLIAWGDTVQNVTSLRSKIHGILAGIPNFRRVSIGYYEYLPDEAISKPSPRAVAERVL